MSIILCLHHLKVNNAPPVHRWQTINIMANLDMLFNLLWELSRKRNLRIFHPIRIPSTPSPSSVTGFIHSACDPLHAYLPPWSGASVSITSTWVGFFHLLPHITPPQLPPPTYEPPTNTILHTRNLPLILIPYTLLLPTTTTHTYQNLSDPSTWNPPPPQSRRD